MRPCCAVTVDVRSEARIAIEHGVKVVEDDIYAFYLDEPLPTVASMVGA